MMHYKPWIHQQQLLVEQHPYYQYASSDLQAYYSSSEPQEEDNEHTDHTGDEMPSETSGDQSPNADMFRLAFAASQWSKLVLNAEGLFNKLMSTNVLPPNEQILLKNQIEQWLCMKQEYEECITGDESASLQGFTENTRRSLERIEEVTETDEKTDESSNWKMQSRTKSCSGSESEVFDDEDQSDTESENPDFFDKLDEYMKKFKDETDELIDSRKNDFSNLKSSSPVPKSVFNNSFVPIIKPIPIRNPSSRRMSILPNSEMSNEIVEFQKQNSNINLQQKDDNHDTSSLSSINSTEKKDILGKCNDSFEKKSTKMIVKIPTMDFENIDAIRPLKTSAQSKQEDTLEKCSDSLEKKSTKMIAKLPNLTVDLENIDAIRSLKTSIQSKQSQVKDILFDLGLAYKQLEELQYTVKVKEQFIDDMLQDCSARNSAKQKFERRQSKLEEKCRSIEKVLNHIRIHRDTKDEAAYNTEIKDYEDLLIKTQKKLKDTKIIKQAASDSAKRLVNLKDSLAVSKKQLEKLKQQLEDGEKRKKTLEDEIIINQKRIKELEKQGSNISKLKDSMSDSDDGKNFSKHKIKCDKNESLVKLEIDKMNSSDEKEILRQEIRSLRDIRDGLIDVKCKFTSEKYSTAVEKQRQLLFINEYVETIDAMIEQKNVMICGKGDFNENKSHRLDEQMSITQRLETLSQSELVNLFYRYFYKVIDLKDSSRNLEIQNTILEESLKKMKIENDTKIMMLEKWYQRKLTHFYKYYAEDTSSSSYDYKLDKNKDFEEQLIKENHALKKRLTHFDTLLKAPRAAQAIQSNSIKSTKQVLKPELMQIESSQTTVTRRGNKLIFQTSKKEK